jgi:hypothetical protein
MIDRMAKSWKMTMRMILGAIAAVVLLGGVQPAGAVSQPFIGERMVFAGNFCPAGWERLEGQLLPKSENETLFFLLGTTYGGDGEFTFGLPNAKPIFTANGGGHSVPLLQCISLFGIFPAP